MARARRPNALEDLTRAALTVFARDGFRGAQMVDVAREMGVALGTVYSYVESKDALFALAVGAALPGAPQVGDVDELPVRGPTADELLDLTRRRLQRGIELPVLEAARRRRRARDPRQELAGVLAELWRLTAATRLNADMIERSARDWPELADLFYQQIRRDLLDRLQAYLAARARSGQFRALADPQIAARMAVETITWWARHRYGDPDAVRAGDDAHVREVVIEMLVDAFVG